MRKTILITAALAVLCSTCLLAGSQRMTKVWIVTKNCRCDGKHGNVFALYSDGHKAKLTTSGMCSSPKLAADGLTCGWLTGKHVDSDKYGYLFVPDKLVLYRGGKCIRTMQGKGDYTGYIVDWQFWQGGTQVALAVGSVRRGTEWYELRDIATSNLLEMRRRWTEEVPAWAAAIAEKD